jgi:deoxyribose-phosphate aldolase
MTRPAQSASASAGLPRSARELLIDWANQQDGWVRAIVGDVVSTRRELSPAAIAIAKDRYLAEKHLAAEAAPAVPVIGATGEDDDAGDALHLVSLRDCRGVNALAENQEIRFHQRMTVLFGENAMGKTGYVRVLKQLANVRSAEPIIPDIHRPSAVTPLEATVRYAVGAEEQEVAWRGETGLSPFTRITVFDSPAVALHLEDSVTYVFTPADLALYRYTHGAIEAVRVLLEQDAATREPRQNPFLTAFARGTPLYAEIEALGASTNVARAIRPYIPETQHLAVEHNTVSCFVPSCVESSRFSARRRDRKEVGCICCMSELSVETLASMIDASIGGTPAPTNDEVAGFFKSLGSCRFAAIMVEPSYVRFATPILNGMGQRLATVIAYPLGAMTTEAKMVQAEQALEDGADELDVAMDLSAFRSGDDRRVVDDLRTIRRLAGSHLVKAIYYSALLNDEESVHAAELVAEAGIGFLKTNPGYGHVTTPHHIRVIKEHFGSSLKVMASGGVRTNADALAMLAAGADRIATSSVQAVLGLT